MRIDFISILSYTVCIREVFLMAGQMIRRNAVVKALVRELEIVDRMEELVGDESVALGLYSGLVNSILSVARELGIYELVMDLWKVGGEV